MGEYERTMQSKFCLNDLVVLKRGSYEKASKLYDRSQFCHIMKLDITIPFPSSPDCCQAAQNNLLKETVVLIFWRLAPFLVLHSEFNYTDL